MTADLDVKYDWEITVASTEELIDKRGSWYVNHDSLEEVSDPWHVASYVPMCLRDKMFRSQVVLHPLPDELMLDQLSGAFVFADAAGFSKLAGFVQSYQGRSGNSLGFLLNSFFGSLIDTATDYGGDILTFSGDAVTIHFPIVTDMQEAVARSVVCSLQLLKNLCNFPHGLNTELKLDLHVGVGVGSVSMSQVGGVWEKWSHVYAGEGIDQVASSGMLAKSGELVLTAEAWAYVAPLVSGSRGSGKYKGYRTLRAKTKVDLAFVAPLASNINRKCFYDSEQFLKTAIRFIPTIALKSDAEMTGFLANEIRKVSVIFVSLMEVDMSTQEGIILGNQATRIVQMCLYAHEGSLNKFGVDDKGGYLMGVFGFYQQMHPDDNLRAMLSAHRINHRLKAAGIKARIGVTTGRVWCGSLGSDIRREFTVLGNAVNVAVFLALKAQPWEVFCDEMTVKMAQHGGTSPDVQVVLHLHNTKIDDVLVNAFRFMGNVTRTTDPLHCLTMNHRKWKEWPPIVEARQMLDQESGILSNGGVLTICGQSGSCKGLVQEVCLEAFNNHGYKVISGSNMEAHQLIVTTRRIQGVKGVLNQALELYHTVWKVPDPDKKPPFSPMVACQIMSDLLPQRFRGLLPLLRDVCDLAVCDKEYDLVAARFTRRSEIWSEIIRLYGIVILQVTREFPVCICFRVRTGTSIVTGYDTLSIKIVEKLALLANMRRRARLKDPTKPRFPIIFLFICRGELLSEHHSFVRTKDFKHLISWNIELRKLDFVSCTTFLSEVLEISADQIPISVKHVLYILTGGQIHAIKLCLRFYREKGWIRREVHDEKVNWVFDVDSFCLFEQKKFRGMLLPEELTALTLCDIDRLTYRQQSILKVASLLSLPFLFHTLCLFYPEATYEDLQFLVSNKIIRKRQQSVGFQGPPVAPERYDFQGLIYRVVAQSLILQEQKKILEQNHHEHYFDWAQQMVGNKKSVISIPEDP